MLTSRRSRSVLASALFLGLIVAGAATAAGAAPGVGATLDRQPAPQGHAADGTLLRAIDSVTVDGMVVMLYRHPKDDGLYFTALDATEPDLAPMSRDRARARKGTALVTNRKNGTMTHVVFDQAGAVTDVWLWVDRAWHRAAPAASRSAVEVDVSDRAYTTQSRPIPSFRQVPGVLPNGYCPSGWVYAGWSRWECYQYATFKCLVDYWYCAHTGELDITAACCDGGATGAPNCQEFGVEWE